MSEETAEVPASPELRMLMVLELRGDANRFAQTGGWIAVRESVERTWNADTAGVGPAGLSLIALYSHHGVEGTAAAQDMERRLRSARTEYPLVRRMPSESALRVVAAAEEFISHIGTGSLLGPGINALKAAVDAHRANKDRCPEETVGTPPLMEMRVEKGAYADPKPIVEQYLRKVLDFSGDEIGASQDERLLEKLGALADVKLTPENEKYIKYMRLQVYGTDEELPTYWALMHMSRPDFDTWREKLTRKAWEEIENKSYRVASKAQAPQVKEAQAFVRGRMNGTITT
jgi:hypothetical protein